MSRVWSTLLVLTVACLVGLSVASAQDAEKKEGPKKPKRSLEQIFQKLDKDADGSLTFEEFKGKRTEPEQLEKAEQRFKRLDKDGDKSVSLKEFTERGPKREKKERREGKKPAKKPDKEGGKKEA